MERKGLAVVTARGWSAQDRSLALHFLAFWRGTPQGKRIAATLARYLIRAKREHGGSVGMYIARLIQADADAHGW